MPTCSGAQAFFTDLFSRPVVIDGREMTTREAYIRATHAKALAGDVGSHVELLRLREACGAGEDRTVGYLAVPDRMTDDEFERYSEEQQRPFREQAGTYNL